MNYAISHTLTIESIARNGSTGVVVHLKLDSDDMDIPNGGARYKCAVDEIEGVRIPKDLADAEGWKVGDKIKIALEKVEIVK